MSYMPLGPPPQVRSETPMTTPELEDVALLLAEALQRLVGSLDERHDSEESISDRLAGSRDSAMHSHAAMIAGRVRSAIPATDLALAESVVRRFGTSS